MSVLDLGIKFAWFKAPDLEFWKWSRAAQRLWAWLKSTNHGNQTQFRFTDSELAKELGIGRRYVQYALQWLEEHGIIRRFKVYGPRNVAGRVIEIVIELAGKNPPAKPSPKAAQAPPRPTPAPPQTAEDTPRRKPGVPPTAEEILAGQAVAAGIRQAIAQSRQQTAPEPPARHPDQQSAPLKWRDSDASSTRPTEASPRPDSSSTPTRTRSSSPRSHAWMSSEPP